MQTLSVDLFREMVDNIPLAIHTSRPPEAEILEGWTEVRVHICSHSQCSQCSVLASWCLVPGQ